MHYKYGVAFRPAGFATVPKGYTLEKHPHYKHGVVVYDKPLLPEQITSFELVPLLSIEDIIEQIFIELKEYSQEYLELYIDEPLQFEMIVGSAFERLNVYPLDIVLNRKELAQNIIDKIKDSAKDTGQILSNNT